HVDLELSRAVDDVVVHALGVLAVVFAARLPVAFQDIPRVVREGTPELGGRGPRCPEDEHTGEKPERSGGRKAHHASCFQPENTMTLYRLLPPGGPDGPRYTESLSLARRRHQTSPPRSSLL